MTRVERLHAVRRAALAGIAAVDAARLLKVALHAFPRPVAHDGSRLALVAAGKSAVPMLSTFAAEVDLRAAAVVLTAPGARAEAPPGVTVRAFGGGHPHPSAGSIAAGRAALALVSGLAPDDRVVVLLSGGASALLAAPAAPVTLDDKVAVTRLLLTRGVAIDGVNTVRKHLSSIKGGQLAAATRASVHTLALSDVHQPFDDDPATIGSGPTVADPTTFAEACRVLDRAEPSWPDQLPRVASRLRAGREGRTEETPKPGDARLARSTFTVIGNRRVAAEATARTMRDAGIPTTVREPALVGEARVASRELIDEVLQRARHMDGPSCVVATGETTVTVRGAGLGGRNQEFVLAAALDLQARGLQATVASVGTDGVDGPTTAAGAVADETTCVRAASRGLDAARALAENDSHAFFDALGDLVVTGPTGTNVGDIMLVVFERGPR